jgi:hypothetical protein
MIWSQSLRMRKVARLCAIVAGVLTASAGCTMQSHGVPASRIMQRVGIAVYPKAKPCQATETLQSFRFGGTTVLGLMCQTDDQLAQVERFYMARVPKDAKRISIPLGFARTVTFQWYGKTSQKQATITEVKGVSGAAAVTVISLQSIEFSLGKPPPDAFPTSSP